MCIMLIIFDVSIENQKIYGILQIEIFPQQKSHIITLDIFCVIRGYHVQHSITQNVFKIET